MHHHELITVFDIKDNPFKLAAEDWFLIAAGNIQSFNMMTASWGAFGELWHKKVAICFVRPNRHTYKFMEQSDCFTINVFHDKYRSALELCGSKSGRDVNKAETSGLTPVSSENGSVYFDEARLILECRKVYIHDLIPSNFLDAEIEQNYPKKDYHRMYIGEILNVLQEKL